MSGFFAYWTYGVAAVSLTISLVASCHIVLKKQNQRAAIGWLGVVWLTPFIGGLLYLALGINRIQRRATRLRPVPVHPRALKRFRPGALAHTPLGGTFVDIVGTITALPLHGGNHIEPLENGEAAYPEMLAAIEGAQQSIALASYIFDNDVIGQVFVSALGRAARRGVMVRILIDSVGSRYTFPSILTSLREAGVTAVEFLPSFAPWRITYLNLRNHRKIMVVDGVIGFTGGMNIRASQLATSGNDGILDVHFRVEGPVVEQLMAVFAEDWAFSSGEVLGGEEWFPPVGAYNRGNVLARGVPSGPDEDYDKLKWVLLGALAAAKKSVRIVTPYFLPDEVMIAALKLKAISGVEVDIIIPEHGNLRLVKWASRGQIGQLIMRGCRVWEQPDPFDHSKIFLIDDEWAFVGSANWDPRSLYLNFEFNMECYGTDFVRRLDRLVSVRMARSRQLTQAMLDARPLPVQLRDGLARMLSPYL